MISDKYTKTVKAAYEILRNDYPEEMQPVIGGDRWKPSVLPASCDSMTIRHVGGDRALWFTTWVSWRFDEYEALVLIDDEDGYTFSEQEICRMLESWCENFIGEKIDED